MTEPIKVFISYAHKDKNFKEIEKDLHKCSSLRGIKLIYDTKEVKHADPIPGFVDQLVKGDHIILVLSEAYFNSHYCMSELLGIWRRGKEVYSKYTHPIITADHKLIDVNDLKEIWKNHNDKDKLHQDFAKEIDELIAFENQRNKMAFSDLKSANYAPLFDRIVEIPAWVSKVHERSEEWILNEKNRCFLLKNGEIDKFYWELQNSNLLLQNETVKQFLDASTKHIKRIKRRAIFFLIVMLIMTSAISALFYWNDQERSKKDIEKRLSMGEKYYLEAYFDKRIGAKELSLSQFGEAKSGFEKSLKEMPDDPEALIYFENTSAIASARAYSEGGVKIRAIAVSVPIQKNITVAKEILRGVAQAQKTINDQWRKGCDIDVKNKDRNCPDRWLLQVLIASDDNDPKIAKDIAKYIAEERKDILAVVGHNSSQVSNAVINDYQDKLVMISPTSYTLDHSVKEIINAKNNYIFSVASPVESVLPVVIDHIKSLESVKGNRNVYFCADPDAHDTARLIKGLEQEITIKGVEKEKNSDKYMIECDISNLKGDDEFLDKAKEEHRLTDLFLSVHVRNSIDAIIMARKNKNSKLNLYSVHTLFSKDVLGKDLEGLIVAVNWHSKSSHGNKENADKSKKFIEDAECIWNRTDNCQGKFDPDIDITWRSAMAYDATQLIIEGLNKIPLQITGDEARKELQEQVSELKLNGITGPIKFKKNGMRIGGKGHLVQVLERCDGKYQFVPLEKQNDSSYKLVFPKEVKFKDSNPKAQCK